MHCGCSLKILNHFIFDFVSSLLGPTMEQAGTVVGGVGGDWGGPWSLALRSHIPYGCHGWVLLPLPCLAGVWCQCRKVGVGGMVAANPTY